MLRLSCSMLVLFAGLLFVGCGGGSAEKVVTVQGTITSGGQPLTVAGEEAGLGYVQVQFFRIDDAGVQSTDPASARVSTSDGSFELAGHGGQGIPPGKYRVAVRQWDPYPEDKLQGKFDETNSPILRTIEGDAMLTIELDQPAG